MLQFYSATKRVADGTKKVNRGSLFLKSQIIGIAGAKMQRRKEL